MKKSKRFQPLVRIAANKELESAKALGAAVNNVTIQKNKLKNLETYRQEYVESFKKQGSTGMDGALLHTYQKFIENIDTALVQQNKLIEQAENVCQQQKQNWMLKHCDSKVMGNVVQQYKRNEQKESDKLEQKIVDESNLRSHQINKKK